MRAALALAGLTVEDVAARIGARGYGAKTLYNMQSEANDRAITHRDVLVLAGACGVDPSFFSIDFSDLAGGRDAGPDIKALQGQVRDLAEAVVALASGQAEDALRAARAVAEKRQPGSAADDPSSGPMDRDHGDPRR